MTALIAEIKRTLRRQTSDTNSNQRLRFNLALLPLVWGIFGIFILGVFFNTTTVAAYFALTLFGFLNCAFTFALIKSAVTVRKIQKTQATYANSNVIDPAVEALEHIVIISVYKEPLALIEQTVRSFADQTLSHRLTLVVGMEEKTPQREEKTVALLQQFENQFNRMIFTYHPPNRSGEIPGKCSNLNYAARTVVQRLQTTSEFNIDKTTFTTCDSDNLFHPSYFEALGKAFIKSGGQKAIVWQSPLFYNWGLDKSPWFTRIIGLLRPIFMMGFLIPFNMNGMSAFSLPLRLYIKGNYTHPGYQMDDIIAVIRWMTEIKNRIEIQPIYLPTLSGPTSGETVQEEFVEWHVQATRWSIGAAEVFHYFCVRFFTIPLRTALSWMIAYIGLSSTQFIKTFV